MLGIGLATDKLGRRPLTVYPYAVIILSVLCLGIIACFHYSFVTLSSLLVRPLLTIIPILFSVLTLSEGVLRLPSNVLDDGCECDWVRLRRRSPAKHPR